MKQLEKMATKDALRWAQAEMAFGEGAGTARKLLNAEINQKYFKIPGYAQVFDDTYDMLDMADIAAKALKDHKKLVRMKHVEKNTRALLRGNPRGMSTGLAVAFTVGVVLHQTGYDKVLYRKAEVEYKKLNRKFQHIKNDLF